MSLFSIQMTPATFFLDFFAYPIFVLASLVIGYWGVDGRLPWWEAPSLVVMGFVVWTLVEYLMHRFAFHHMPYVKDLHMAHHRDVNGMIATPTTISFISLFLLAYLPMAFLIGGFIACFWFAGMLAGYLAFAAVHYAVHHFSSGGLTSLRKLKRAHAIHHHGDNQFNFGVTTLFWDRVFGTYSERVR
ncbi:MAG: sterol desaturase family protein [Alphaproteobacteria bacterium]|nr:sterol desaturase family protein [Alphaproteobacteria bacterium]